VREWFVENFPPEFSEETEARLQRIFEGDEAEMAYHVGAKAYTPKALGALGHFPNLCTIGIELCHPGADGRFSAETLGAAAELCALLCIQGGLDPLADIWTHHDITGKDCPKWFVERPEEFAEFKQGVSKIANWLRG
jgi:N-acetylmuramoyl-L-alanine amidase